MSIDRKQLEALCEETLAETDFAGLSRRITGKVRDSYLDFERAPGRRTIVVSDRVSCFDRVVGTIPLKGQILNRMAAFWFEQTKEIAPNHLIDVPDPNVSIVRMQDAARRIRDARLSDRVELDFDLDRLRAGSAGILRSHAARRSEVTRKARRTDPHTDNEGG